MTNPDTLTAVEQASADLAATGDPVTFAAIAERTGLSRTTLYRDDGLRAVIEEHRARSRDARTLSGPGLRRELDHLRTAADTLADRVRRQEERPHPRTPPPRQLTPSAHWPDNATTTP